MAEHLGAWVPLPWIVACTRVGQVGYVTADMSSICMASIISLTASLCKTCCSVHDAQSVSDILVENACSFSKLQQHGVLRLMGL